MKKITIFLLIAVTHQWTLHTMQQSEPAAIRYPLLLDWVGAEDEVVRAMTEAARTMVVCSLESKSKRSAISIDPDKGCVTLVQEETVEAVTFSQHRFIQLLDEITKRQTNAHSQYKTQHKNAKKGSIRDSCKIN